MPYKFLAIKKLDFLLMGSILLFVTLATILVPKIINQTRAELPTSIPITFLSTPTTVSGTTTIMVQTSSALTSLTFFVDSTQTSGQSGSYPGVTTDGLKHSFLWNTTTYPNGVYQVKATATVNGQYSENFITVTLANTTSTNASPLVITFLTSPTTATGATSIKIKVNKPVDQVNFLITATGIEQTFAGTLESGSSDTYFFDWLTTNFPNTQHKIKAITRVGNETAEQYILVSVQNHTTTVPALTIEFLNPPTTVSETVTISAKVNKAVTNFNFDVIGATTQYYPANQTATNTYSFTWDTTTGPNGEYKIKGWATAGEEMSDKQFTVTVQNTTTATPLSVQFLTAPSTASGIVLLSAKVNKPLTELKFIIEGATTQNYLGTKTATNTYVLHWNTANFPDGNYKVKAKAQSSTSEIIENYFYTTVANTSTTTVPLAITFSSYSDIATGTKTISVQVNKPVDEFKFSVTGATNYTYPATKISTSTYSFQWPTTNIPNGPYTIKATAKAGTEIKEQTINLTVQNPSTITPTPSPPTLKVQFLAVPTIVSGLITISAQANLTLEESKFVITGPQTASYPALISTAGTYYFAWDTPKFPNGQYKVKFLARAGGQTAENYAPVIIQNQTIKPPTTTTPTVATTSTTNVTTPPEPLPPVATPPTVTPTPIVPPAPKPTTTIAPSTATATLPLLSLADALPWRCQEAGIESRLKCDQFLLSLKLAPECRHAQVKTQAECDQLLLQIKLPQACREVAITSADKCKQYLAEKYDTQKQCGDLGVEECKNNIENKFTGATLFIPPTAIQNLRIEKMPIDCQTAGLTDFDACQKLINSKYLSRECLALNINSPEECQKALAEKYGKPQECLGLTDAQCGTAIKKITPVTAAQLAAAPETPAECREAGLTSLEECETWMRSRYLVNDCLAKGATTKEECASLIQTAYGKPALCTKLTPEVCKNLIDKIILADFLPPATMQKAQTEIKLLANKHLEIKSGAGVTSAATPVMEISVTTPAGESQLLSAETVKNIAEVLPITKKPKPVGFSLRQTLSTAGDQSSVSAVVLFDQDNDNLTDDLEKRFGTDPNNPDTDADGFTDGAEVASGYDPLGSGELTAPLQPLEKAIVNQVPLEQPLNAGITDTTLVKISGVESSITQETSFGQPTVTLSSIKISGQAPAGSTVALYIYSPMPIVITVKTDDQGNWIYDLDKTLVDGKHESYVVLHDEGGRILAKSAPVPFFIQQAKAVSRAEMIQATDAATPADETTTAATPDSANTTAAAPATVDQSSSATKWYIIAGISIILLGLILFIIHRQISKAHAPKAGD